MPRSKRERGRDRKTEGGNQQEEKQIEKMVEKLHETRGGFARDREMERDILEAFKRRDGE